MATACRVRERLWERMCAVPCQMWSGLLTFADMTPDVLTAPARASKPVKPRREVALDDKYVLEDGLVFMSGIHALVRMTLDQMRARDRKSVV